MNNIDIPLIEKIITYNYNEFGKEFGDTLVDLKRAYIYQKEVLDKIKEYITTRTPSDIGICGNEPKKYYTLNEDEVDYILELLEEIE